MPNFKSELRKYLLGIIFIAAGILGGGAAPGLWTDTVLQVLILLCATPILAAPDGEVIDRKVKWFCGLVLLAMAIQLLPLPAQLFGPFRGDLLLSGRQELGATGPEFISLGLGRTLEALLYVGVLIIFLFALLRLPGEQLHALLPFFLIGVGCNALAALIQYSASSRVTIDDLLPFTIMAGFFANRNHFSSLLYTALPFLLYMATFSGKRIWSLIAISFLLLVILAAGSRAGALLGLAALMFSLAFFVSRSRVGIWGIIVLTTVLGVYGMGAWTLIEARELTDLTRAQFARTTLEGIGDNWLLGIGFGNFPFAYQVYEDVEAVFRSYVNHAHNDYLEVIFEGGIIAVLLLAAYLVMLCLQLLRVRYSHFHKAAFLGILFVLIHSFVDYPLRTMAVATAFIYFNAILFHRDLQPGHRHIKGLVEVRDGNTVRHFAITDEASQERPRSSSRSRRRSSRPVSKS